MHRENKSFNKYVLLSSLKWHSKTELLRLKEKRRKELNFKPFSEIFYV